MVSARLSRSLTCCLLLAACARAVILYMYISTLTPILARPRAHFPLLYIYRDAIKRKSDKKLIKAARAAADERNLITAARGCICLINAIIRLAVTIIFTLCKGAAVAAVFVIALVCYACITVYEDCGAGAALSEKLKQKKRKDAPSGGAQQPSP